ncbi:MAG: chloride channel protein [Desulfosarcinaceae bacterium]|nr:chloride channel protein [Desulfosarcinaceae bacterium]
MKLWRYPANWHLFRYDDRLLLICMAVVVGICAGLAAIALNRALVSVLGLLHHYRHLWWAFIMPAAGAALSSLFLEKIVNEGAGHGVPEVIYSVSRYGGLIRLRSSFSRLISSCLTIGSGGSAGPEAPVVMSGSAIGSNIARLFNLNDRQRVTLVGCGTAGAIGAIFNAPIAGMVFTMEVILGEWSAVNIIPIAIAAVTGTKVSRLLQGNNIAFSHREFQIALGDIAACVGLAICCAAVSIILTRSLRGMSRRVAVLRLPLWLKAAMGGAIVGLIGIGLPDVLGEGYHTIQHAITGDFRAGLLVATTVLAMKIVATAFTLGWGGSGGIFAPSLFIGSFVGLAYQRALTHLWPTVGWVEEGCFALLGMAGIISGILQAPLTGIFLIVEITGGYDVIVPLTIVAAVSSTACQYVEPASFYLKDLVDKGQLLRPGTDARVLADIRMGELLETDCIPVSPGMRLGEFIPILERSHRNLFPVEDGKNGRFLGIVHLDDVRPYLFKTPLYDAVVLGQLMQTQVETVGPDDDLIDVLDKMDALKKFSLPVVANQRFVGMISKATLLDRYRRELMVQTRTT